MKFLRTVSTARLLAMITGLVIAVAAGTAIAVAARGSGPVPKAKPLAQTLHSALTAKPVGGISADIQFTDNLIPSADFAGDHRDPLLQGASGRLWMSKAGGLRLELQSGNGDTQVVVKQGHWWISDPSSHTVYAGTLPADMTKTTAGSKPSAGAEQGVPSVATLQTDINKLLGHLNLGGARTSDPTDVGGQPAYSVTVSPKHDGGLLGRLGLAWDALTGTPLDIAVFARGQSAPVLELKLTNVSFGKPAGYAVPMPSGYKVVKVASPAGAGAGGAEPTGKAAKHHAQVTGPAAVAKHLSFKLAAPARLVGLPRQSVQLLDWGGKPAALVSYGQNLGGITIIEQAPDKASSSPSSGAGQSSGSGPSNAMGNLSLPSVTINGSTGSELPTALGTVLRYTRGGVTYTVLGSVPPYVAEKAAQRLTP